MMGERKTSDADHLRVARRLSGVSRSVNGTPILPCQPEAVFALTLLRVELHPNQRHMYDNAPMQPIQLVRSSVNEGAVSLELDRVVRLDALFVSGG